MATFGFRPDSRFAKLSRKLVPFAIFAVGTFGAYALLPVWGEPPRLEQEYKLSFSGALTETEKRALYDLVSAELSRIAWENAKYVTSPYYMGSDLDTLEFEDLYFDDASGSLEKAGISHRFRYRWKTSEDRENFLSGKILPQRFEIQTKVYGRGAIANGEGYKKALKNRYEIKNDYRLTPVTRYLLRRENADLVARWLSNPLVGARFSPVKLVLDAAREYGISGLSYADLRPSVRLVTERTRFHVNKATPFGYGDNPDNVFLISIDEATAYPVASGGAALATFSEIEIDFERNTFFKLFDSVYRAGNESDRRILASFEADQSKLKGVVAAKLAEMGHPVEEGEMSTKYSKAAKAASGTR